MQRRALTYSFLFWIVPPTIRLFISGSAIRIVHLIRLHKQGRNFLKPDAQGNVENGYLSQRLRSFLTKTQVMR